MDSADQLPSSEGPQENQSPQKKLSEKLPPERRSPENCTDEVRPAAKSPADLASPDPLRSPSLEVPVLPLPPVEGLTEWEESPLESAVVLIPDEVTTAAKVEVCSEGVGSRMEGSKAAAVVNRLMRRENRTQSKVGESGDGFYRLASIQRRKKREALVRKANLTFRVLGMIFCVVSFSVMAANRTKGWTGDSFERHKQYRYCLSITVIGFVYSGFQALLQAQLLVTEKQAIWNPVLYYLDFFMDQILAYLLMSASSSAATRTDDWVMNWGEDEFTKMASASIGMSFLAFFTFASSSLISGYILCTYNA